KRAVVVAIVGIGRRENQVGIKPRHVEPDQAPAEHDGFAFGDIDGERGVTPPVAPQAAPAIGRLDVDGDLTISLLVGKPHDLERVDVLSLEVAIDRKTLRNLANERLPRLSRFVVESLSLLTGQKGLFLGLDFGLGSADNLRSLAVRVTNRQTLQMFL